MKILHKNLVKAWFILVVLGLIGIFLASIVVDPLDILGTPIIKGINNNKVKQERYLDVFKPYHIVKYKPEVVFIGSSRIYYAWEPTLNGYDKEKVYNMGFSSLPLNHMEKYLDFVYKINVPKKVFIGLDFFQFGKNNFIKNNRNFSDERLRNLSENESELFFEALKENFQVSYLIGNTIKESFENRSEVEIFERGWYATRGNCKDLNKKAYYDFMSGSFNTYRNWKYEEKSIEFLKNSVAKAREKGIEVFIFFNPISVDLISLIKVFNLMDDLNMVKRKVVDAVDIVYDFNFINVCTTNRHELYYDLSHGNKKFGDILKNDIIQGKDSERMRILTSKNIEQQLMTEMKLNEFWFNENEKYIEYLNNKKIVKKKLKQGELKEFIGF